MSFFFRPEVRECRRCGNSFEAKGKRQYYCSETCRRESPLHVELVCETCGRTFQIERWLYKKQGAKYCSRECYHNQRPQVERTCQICGKRFKVKAYYAEAGWGQYCSQECQQQEYKRHRVQRICENCGKEFSVIVAVAKKEDGGKYCSKECRDAAKRDYVSLTCQQCGKEFALPRSEYDRGKGKFCSKKCFNENIYAQVVLTCEHCGEEFVTHKSNIESGGGRFCSRDCYQQYLQVNGQDWYKDHEDATDLAICERCGKEFKIRPNRERRFCSFSCQLLYRGETSIEKAIREELERRGVAFDQNVRIGKFIVDFLLLNENKIIECDGEYWHNLPGAKARDQYKDKYLLQKGFEIFRFTESEIRRAASECVDQVLRG